MTIEEVIDCAEKWFVPPYFGYQDRQSTKQQFHQARAELAALRAAADRNANNPLIADMKQLQAKLKSDAEQLQSRNDHLEKSRDDYIDENERLRKRVAELERQVEHMQPRYELGGECLTEFRKTLSIQEIEHNLYALVWNFDHHEQEAALDELTRMAQENGEYD